MLLNDVEYAFSERVTDLHLGIIETFLDDLTDGNIASEAAFLLKYVVFEKPLPDELIEKIQDRYIIFIESSVLLDIYKNLYYKFVSKNLRNRIELESNPEKIAQIENALDNLTKVKEKLDSGNLTIENREEITTDISGIVKQVVKELELQKK